MSVFTYARWGLTRKREMYKPVYFSVFLMSLLVFLSLSLLPLSAKEMASTVGNGYGSSKAENAPMLLFVLGAVTGVLQILLVLIRVQIDRSAEYRMLRSLGVSLGKRAFVAGLENTGHILIGSSAGVFTGALGLVIVALLSGNMSLLAGSSFIVTVSLAIFLPVATCLPFCAVLATNGRSR